MNLVTVIPLSKGISVEHLTYFSEQSPVLGSLVTIMLRSKKISGLVFSVEKALDKKTAIKNLPFGIKKIENATSREFLSPSFITACRNIADYYATTTGAVLTLLVPKSVLLIAQGMKEKTKKKNVGPQSTSTDQTQTEETESEKDKTFSPTSSRNEIVALQMGVEERSDAYKRLIREEFARKKSVFLCVPSIADIEHMYQKVSKGIEEYVLLFSASVSQKKLAKAWQEMEMGHPILIISTAYFLSLPRADIGTIIIEKESSRGYMTATRPYLDLRTVAEYIASASGCRLILADTALRTETIFRERGNEIGEFSTLQFRVLAKAQSELADMRQGAGIIKKDTGFTIIGNTLGHLLKTAAQNNERTFLLTARKGLAPITVCADCGQSVSCVNCGAPTTLYEPKSGDNFFLCHKCRTRQNADVVCTRCSSWRLVPLGIGIDAVEKELKKKFPDQPLFVMDRNHITTHDQAETMVKHFLQSGTGILLGTEMAIDYISEIENTGIVSIDSFFNIPDFRMREKIISILTLVRAVATKRFIVQTRRPEEKVFEYALKGNLSDFYTEELKERKQFGYPPFQTFIKITLEGPKATVRAKMESLQKDFKPLELSVFEAYHSGPDRIYAVHGLLSLPRDSWPNSELRQKLRHLSPEYSVRINPDTLL